MPNPTQNATPNLTEDEALALAAQRATLGQTCREWRAIEKISLENWRIATALAEAWVAVDYEQQRAKEAVETHRLNPNRREPHQIFSPHHPSIAATQQQVELQPIEQFSDSHQPGYHWGFYQDDEFRILLDADSREAALALHQTLALLLQDATVRRDMLTYQVHRIRIRRRLTRPDGTPVLGYCDGNGVFSLDADQPIPYTAITAAHQVGHAMHGTSDVLANQYAGQYRVRNQVRFKHWQSQLQTRLATPAETIQHAMGVVKRQAPEVYERLKGTTIRSNERTGFARPQDILGQMAFVDLQQGTERSLWKRGIFRRMPMELDDCISHNAVNVLPPPGIGIPNVTVGAPTAPTAPIAMPSARPAPAQSSPVAVPTSSGQAADHEWLRDPTLRQDSAEYPESFFLHNLFAALAEGGVCQYRGIRIVGTKANCEAIKKAIDECWADPQAKALIWRYVRMIYASRLEGCWGLSMSRGDIVINPEYPHKLAPNRDAIHAGSTILHEALHEAGHGGDRHPWIRREQNEFAKRRYEAKGIQRFHLPYSPELINARTDY